MRQKNKGFQSFIPTYNLLGQEKQNQEYRCPVSSGFADLDLFHSFLEVSIEYSRASLGSYKNQILQERSYFFGKSES